MNRPRIVAMNKPAGSFACACRYQASSFLRSGSAPSICRIRTHALLGQSGCVGGSESSKDTPVACERRRLISTGIALLSLPQCLAPTLMQPQPAAANEFHIQDLIDAAQPGDVIQIPGGTYYEKLFLRKPVVLEPASKTESVTVVWETADHYEPVLSCDGVDGAIVRGLCFKHSSPSIANNYAVFLQGGRVVIEGCDITTSSGSGVAAEGGEHQILQCRIHDCERHGVAVFGTLEGDECKVLMKGSKIQGNKQNGVLVRDQGNAEIYDCEVQGNSEYGVSVTFAGCAIGKSSIIKGNRKGGLDEGAGSDVVLEQA